MFFWEWGGWESTQFYMRECNWLIHVVDEQMESAQFFFRKNGKMKKIGSLGEREGCPCDFTEFGRESSFKKEESLTADETLN